MTYPHPELFDDPPPKKAPDPAPETGPLVWTEASPHHLQARGFTICRVRSGDTYWYELWRAGIRKLVGGREPEFLDGVQVAVTDKAARARAVEQLKAAADKYV